MALHIDSTGIELTAGPLQFCASRCSLGFAWEGRIDALVETTSVRPSAGRWVEAWKSAPGWVEALAFGLRLSVQVGERWKESYRAASA